MKFPRWQLFEFNDAPWAPHALKQHIIESLSHTIRWGGLLDGVVEPFNEFLAAAGSREVLDLASGAGGPAAILLEAMKKAGQPLPHFLLTDLQPQPESWSRLKARFDGEIDFESAPVDMTAIAPELGRGRPRAIINALHHFPPDLARTLLEGAAAGSPGLFIAEALTRNPARATAVAMTGVPAMLLNPLLCHDHRLSKLLLNWPVPVGLAAGIWDGAVSSMRGYNEAELRALVAPWSSDWRWTYGEYTYPPWGKGSYFWGVPAPHGASVR